MKKELILSNSHNAKSFANHNSEFLQEAAFSKVCRLIKDKTVTTDCLTSDDDIDFYEQRGHYSILINGKRGSGKTTFALTALKRLEAEGLDGIGTKKSEFINLGILDPTLIDSKEHVLLAVIAKIKQKVERYNFHTPANNYAADSLFTKHTHPLDGWRKALSDLAKGLQQLDGVGSSSMQDSIWEDPISIMEEGLLGIHAGLDLNKRLHIFIKKSLELLKAEFFILVLDDIDTFFEKGWPVLEALRKYLTSPQLLTLVCGDLQLYQAQVQRQQWQQLGDLTTKFETDSKSRANHEVMVRALTEQYLLKVLPANRRVDLSVVAELSDVNIYKSLDEKKEQQTAQTFTDYINQMLKTSYLLSPQSAEGRLFREFLARRPLRMAIQLLQSLHDYELPVEVLQSIFGDWVYQYGVSKLLQKSDSNPLLVQQSLEVLHSSGLMQDNLELLPRYSDDSSNAGAAVMSRLLCSYFKHNPGKALDYMVRGGMMRQALYFSGINDKRPSDTHIMRAMATTTSDDLLTVTRQWSPVVVHGLSRSSESLIHFGTVQILSEGTFVRNRSQRALRNLFRTRNRELIKAYAEAEADQKLLSTHSNCKALAKGMHFLSEYYDQRKIKQVSQHYAISPLQLQTILNNSLQPELKYCAGLLFVNVSQGNSNYYRASGLNLIGFLGGVLDFSANNMASESQLENEVRQELKRSGQIRTYPVPVDFSVLETSEKPDDLEDDLDTDDGFQGEEEFEQEYDAESSEEQGQFTPAQQLAQWLLDWSRNDFAGLEYPAHVWSRIWQRFYYTLEQQDKTYKPRQRFLGVIIHRQIVGFLNAVLVEELRHKKDMANSEQNFASVSMNNPVLADKIYLDNYNNLRKTDPEHSNSPLHHYLLNCPLWAPFLEEELSAALFKNTDKPAFYLDDRNQTKLGDLLNLIAPARGDENNIPTLWSHDVLQKHLLSEKSHVLEAIMNMAVKKDDKDLNVFVREHLARTSNAQTVNKIKDLKSKQA